MAAAREVWGETTDGLRVHALEWGDDRNVPALVFVPGGTGNAWSAENLAVDEQWRARRVLGISRRGMGRSEAPSRGYAPADFADDVAALVRAAGIDRFALFGHSMGVPISLEYALRQPEGLAGLILGDAPAAYIDFATAGTFDQLFTRPLEFANWDEAFSQIGLGDRERFDRVRHRYLAERDGKVVVLIDASALRQTVEESRTAQKHYWARLREIRVPRLLLRATSGWSPLTDDDVSRYAASWPDVPVTTLPTGHDLGLTGDPSHLVTAISDFLVAIDRAATRTS